MAKNVGAKLSRKLKQKMQIVGGKLSCLDCVVRAEDADCGGANQVGSSTS